MTFRDFLSDRFVTIVIWLICAVFSALFLIATGTQPGVVMILLLVLFLVSGTALFSVFFRRRASIKELEAVFEGLDQKYLFAECVCRPRELYERQIFALCRRAGQAMIGEVSEARAAQREYREYVESWIHEIKAPITAAGLICRSVDEETRRRLTRELAQIEAHVERALFYARAESVEKDFIIRQTMLSDLAVQAIDRHRALLVQSGIQIEMAGLEQAVFTDSKWTVFILGQLLQNAARYHGHCPVIALSARQLGKQVQLVVKDNGIGIPAHELTRVFDRGFTGSNGRTRGGSTGMGLYLCRKLADCMETDIRIESDEGRGTSVTLTFPSKENLTKS